MNFILDYNKHVFADRARCSVTGKVRSANEDHCDWRAKTPNGDVFVVCDGMGGHVGGKKASTTAVKAIVEYLSRRQYPDPQQALHDALQFANTQIKGFADNHPEYKGMGTTACVLLLQGERAWIAHAGDSRIYLFESGKQCLHRITKDHSYVQRVLVDVEGLPEEEAERHPQRNVILKALGTNAELNPEVAPEPVLPEKDDIFLICSDGLTGMIRDTRIGKTLAQEAGTLQQKGETLIRLANNAGGKDNITAQLIRIEQSPHKQSVFKAYKSIPIELDPIAIPPPKPKPKIWKWAVAAAVVIAMAMAAGIYYSISDGIIYEWRLEKAGLALQKAKDERDAAEKTFDNQFHNFKQLVEMNKISGISLPDSSKQITSEMVDAILTNETIPKDNREAVEFFFNLFARADSIYDIKSKHYESLKSRKNESNHRRQKSGK